MKIISLAKAPEFITQYVDLRNIYKENLLTNIVTAEETLEWLNRSDICVEVAINDQELLGAVILYLNKDAELAIFTKYHRQGVANKLLQSVKMTAKQTYSLEYIWAWVADENKASLSLFLRNGFSKIKTTPKLYNNMTILGSMYRYEFKNIVGIK